MRSPRPAEHARHGGDFSDGPAKNKFEYTLQIGPNYAHADEIHKVLSRSPVTN
jgi:hypothetical protein